MSKQTFPVFKEFFLTGRIKAECFAQQDTDWSDVFVNAFLVTLMPPQGFQQPGFKFIIVHPPEYTEIL